MKIILLQDVEKLGKKNEIKEVADGYARNFLIPNKMAVLATKSEVAKVEEQNRIKAQKAEEELARFQEVASQLDGVELEIVSKADDEGKLFGAVGAADIAEKLKEQGLEIDKSQIKTKKPLKEVGEYEITIELPHNLEVKIKAIVVAEKK
ncbi:50S ribosomal protein L9 [Patescibacteria group bacterium]|nr:50S ribosomal protein L9 [Patescibacteria group bacterium]MBU2579949.1 50S ribosomal protein L9 [Patescibacteria group bacterium]MBU4030556.1 50S ribosomal protein L9 [Patescibacteria group bacterium]MBU4082892.1 50S ribosomal protein L9 [Patescibacteria group bacterium]MCG2809443.1 50S ribosomal protein L9 [Candidatus Portnoybacteria bacterium]